MTRDLRVRITDLFWDSLDDLRGTPRYDALREKVHEMVKRKMDGLPAAGGDTLFTNKDLKDIWHLKISSSPFKVLFYARQGDTISLCHVGDHSEYGYKGKNAKLEAALGARIRNGLAKQDYAYADWDPPRWNDPAEIVGHPDLDFMSKASLNKLHEQLVMEGDSLAKLEAKAKAMGADANDLFEKWAENLDAATAEVYEIRRLRPTDPTMSAFREMKDGQQLTGYSAANACALMARSP